jgi:dTDP-4-amino-4,6-dideoxygalactose transaminase
MSKVVIQSGSPLREKKLPLNSPYFDREDEEAVREAVRSSWVVGDGPKCREFEEEFAEYLGVKYALLTNSCTAALHLAFMSLGLEEGEAVIPDYTFTSTALAPILNGMTVKICDVEYETANIDPALFKKSITKKTKAVVPVDYAGHPCRIDEVNDIADRYGLIVIHDTAQSCGSKYKGELIGRQARVSCFSFHATKNLVTGEGGCLVTNDDKLAEKAYIMREKGTNKRSLVLSGENIGYFEYQTKGHSYIQSNILGALALSQLKKLDWMNQKRREHARYLNKGLQGTPGIEIPHVAEDVETNWAIYAIRVLNGKLLPVRDALRSEGIECNTHYHPLHINSYYRNMIHCREEDFPNANKVYSTLLRLPMYPQLMRQDLDDIITAVKKVMSFLA